MGIFTGELLRQFSSPIILPFNSITYANVLNQELNKFLNTFKSKFESINIKLDDLEDSIKNFSITAEKFSKRLKSINKAR